MVKHVGGYFSDSCLTRFYARSARFAAKRTLHVAGIIRRKCFLVDRFENSNSSDTIAEEVSSTSTILGKLGAMAISESLSGFRDAVL